MGLNGHKYVLAQMSRSSNMYKFSIFFLFDRVGECICKGVIIVD